MILTHTAADWVAILAHLRRVGQGELADWLESRLPADLADRPPMEPVSVAIGRRYALVTALEARDALKRVDRRQTTDERTEKCID